MNDTAKARLKALFAKSATSALVDSLQILEAKRTTSKAKLDEFELMARAWTIEELERRFPAASQAVEDAFMESEAALMGGGQYAEVDYVGILIANIK